MSDLPRNKKNIRVPKTYTVKTVDPRSHAFNLGLAIDYSPYISIWLSHLAHWTEKNLANETNLIDGLAWSYDSLDALCDQMPYFTRRQLETVINNSVEESLIVRGNHNQTAYDRTCWYAMTPKSYFYFPHLLKDKYMQRLVKSISQNCNFDFTDLCNGKNRSVTPIPDTIPDTDPDTNKTLVDFEKSTTKKINVKDYEKDERFMRFYTAYPKHEQPRDAWKAFKSIVGNDDALLEHILNDLEVRKEKHTQWRDKQYIKLPAGYLRTGAFEGEIFNELEEQKQKQERDRIENERRLAEQAALSQKRADEIRQNDISKQSDAKTYRQVVKDAPRNPTERPVGLQNLIRSVGLNNNVNRKGMQENTI